MTDNNKKQPSKQELEALLAERQAEIAQIEAGTLKPWKNLDLVQVLRPITDPATAELVHIELENQVNQSIEFLDPETVTESGQTLAEIVSKRVEMPHPRKPGQTYKQFQDIELANSMFYIDKDSNGRRWNTSVKGTGRSYADFQVLDEIEKGLAYTVYKDYRTAFDSKLDEANKKNRADYQANQDANVARTAIANGQDPDAVERGMERVTQLREKMGTRRQRR